MSPSKVWARPALHVLVMILLECHTGHFRGFVFSLRRTTCKLSVEQEASMPLWLRPFEVLVTSNRTSLIEMVPNTLSIHAIKSKCPPGTSLRDFFFTLFPQVSDPIAA